MSALEAQSVSGKAIAFLREKERRQNVRTPMELLGRCLLADGSEVSCRTVNVSVGGLEVAGPRPQAVGERVVCHVEDLGWLDGEVRRLTANGFGMTFAGTPERRARIAAKVEWLVRNREEGVVDNRRDARIVPLRKDVVVRLGARDEACSLIDVSRSGAAIASPSRPDLGSLATVGMRRGKVVRHIPEGFAVEFALPLPAAAFGEHLVL